MFKRPFRLRRPRISDYSFDLDAAEESLCPTCGKPTRLDFAHTDARGLLFGCCCGIENCCNDGFGSVTVTIAGVSACALNTCYAVCDPSPGGSLPRSIKLTALPSVNGTWRATKSSETLTRCSYRATVSATFECETDANNTDCSTLTDGQSAPTFAVDVTISKATKKVASVVIIPNGFDQGVFDSRIVCSGDEGEWSLGDSIPNSYTSCGNAGCPCGPTGTSIVAYTGGTAVVEQLNCCECEFCAGCSEADQTDCADEHCCTPTVIRATTSGITVDFDTCITGATKRWRLTGTTAANRTIDLVQDPDDKCSWVATVAADWVLHRYALATCLDEEATISIPTLRFRLQRSNGTTNGWRWRVVGMDGLVERISIVGSNPGSCGFSHISSTATANKCADTITAPTHLTRATCVNEFGPVGIFGSGGSTTFSVCP